MEYNLMKTTILIDDELWMKFSIIVIKERGYRKKNEVITELIQKYVYDKTHTQA